MDQQRMTFSCQKASKCLVDLSSPDEVDEGIDVDGYGLTETKVESNKSAPLPNRRITCSSLQTVGESMSDALWLWAFSRIS